VAVATADSAAIVNTRALHDLEKPGTLAIMQGGIWLLSFSVESGNGILSIAPGSITKPFAYLNTQMLTDQDESDSFQFDVLLKTSVSRESLAYALSLRHC